MDKSVNDDNQCLLVETPGELQCSEPTVSELEDITRSDEPAVSSVDTTYATNHIPTPGVVERTVSATPPDAVEVKEWLDSQEYVRDKVNELIQDDRRTKVEETLGRKLTDTEYAELNLLMATVFSDKMSNPHAVPPGLLSTGYSTKSFSLAQDNIESGSSAALDELRVEMITLLEKYHVIPVDVSDTTPDTLEVKVSNLRIEVSIEDRGAKMKFGVDLTGRASK